MREIHEFKSAINEGKSTWIYLDSINAIEMSQWSSEVNVGPRVDDYTWKRVDTLVIHYCNTLSFIVEDTNQYREILGIPLKEEVDD